MYRECNGTTHLELAQEVFCKLCTGCRYCHSSVQFLELFPAGLGPVLAHVCLAEVELGRQVLDFDVLCVVKRDALDACQDDILGCMKWQLSTLLRISSVK